MGNGPGVNSGVLTIEMIEEAAERALANFGKPNNPITFMPPGAFWTVWEQHPEYRGTPWAHRGRLNKGEHMVAKLHTFLKKLDALKNIKDEEFEIIKDLSVKQLKRAKWASMRIK